MAFFLKLKVNYLSKMDGYPQFSLWIPRILSKMQFLRTVLNPAKNISVLVSITDRKPEYLEVRRMYAQ